MLVHCSQLTYKAVEKNYLTIIDQIIGLIFLVVKFVHEWFIIDIVNFKLTYFKDMTIDSETLHEPFDFVVVISIFLRVLLIFLLCFIVIEYSGLWGWLFLMVQFSLFYVMLWRDSIFWCKHYANIYELINILYALMLLVIIIYNFFDASDDPDKVIKNVNLSDSDENNILDTFFNK